MALARIITRSHTCSRQLAFDLIARGYAVEIVSPDSIPDNLADLELRVEEDPGNQLVANVEAHNGEHTASLEFVHYLKAPMPDFIRRPPPEPHEAVHFPEPPVSFNAEQSAEPAELPADAPQLAPETVSSAAEILRDSKLDPRLDPKPDFGEGARLILPPDPFPSAVEPPGHDAVVVSTMVKPTMAKAIIAKAVITKLMIAKLTIAKLAIAKLAIARTVRKWEWRDIRTGWSSWRIALTVVIVVLLALVLGFGMRRTGKASAAQNSGAASRDMNLLNATVPQKNAGKNPVLPPAIKSDANSNHTPKESQVTKAAAPTASSGAMISRRHGDDSIARDTVTYLDNRTADKAASGAKTSQPSSSRQPISGKHDGVIAANAVSVLTSNPVPKATKPDSGIKRYSDLK